MGTFRVLDVFEADLKCLNFSRENDNYVPHDFSTKIGGVLSGFHFCEMSAEEFSNCFHDVFVSILICIGMFIRYRSSYSFYQTKASF